MADVQRVLKIREDKPALQALLQKGSIDDDLWNSLLAAEKELEAEIMEVVAEANSFVEGWGQVIFPTANEMLANEKMRAVFERTAEAKLEIGTFRQSTSCRTSCLKLGCRAKVRSQSKTRFYARSPTGNLSLSPSFKCRAHTFYHKTRYQSRRPSK
jgi:hypothetical protein